MLKVLYCNPDTEEDSSKVQSNFYIFGADFFCGKRIGTFCIWWSLSEFYGKFIKSAFYGEIWSDQLSASQCAVPEEWAENL